MGIQSKLTAPSIRGTYGLLVGVGAAVLAVGLLIPFLVADPVTDQLATDTSLPPVLGEDGNGFGGNGGPGVSTGGPGGTGSTVPGAAGPGATLPGGAPAPGGPGGTGGTGTDAPGGGGGGGGGAPEARTASDIGITADTITVGIPIPDVAALGDVEGGASFGGSFGDPETQWRAYIDDINERGGIHGRQVEPVFRKFDTFDPDTMLAACVYLTEEVGVFAVLGGFYGDAILCVTEQHEIPMIAMAAEGDDFYQRANGRYFSIGASKDRTLRDLANFLHADGALEGRTIGILDQEGIDSIPVDRTFLPELERLGYDVAYHARIAAEGSAAQAQIPLEVQRMRSAGVDLVLPASNFLVAALFAQEGEAQRYRPTYYLSDFAGGATDVYVAAMPDTFEGAIGYTSFRTGEAAAGVAEQPLDAACRRTFEAQTGETVDPTILAYYYTVSYCGIAQLFERAMTGAGVNPTRAGFSSALQGIGAFDLAYGGAGSFGPGKYDAADAVRRVTYRANCSCWLPIDDFRVG